MSEHDGRPADEVHVMAIPAGVVAQFTWATIPPLMVTMLVHTHGGVEFSASLPWIRTA